MEKQTLIIDWRTYELICTSFGVDSFGYAKESYELNFKNVKVGYFHLSGNNLKTRLVIGDMYTDHIFMLENTSSTYLTEKEKEALFYEAANKLHKELQNMARFFHDNFSVAFDPEFIL